VKHQTSQIRHAASSRQALDTARTVL